jgi:hypothetical protein
VKILGAMATPDGRWRFEVVRQGREQRYRMFRDGQLLPYRGAVGMFERLLADDGYGMADLIDVSDQASSSAALDATAPAALAARRRWVRAPINCREFFRHRNQH